MSILGESQIDKEPSIPKYTEFYRHLPIDPCDALIISHSNRNFSPPRI